jgi:protein gp37
MADSSAIEWTDATWNPVTGCTKITLGCDFCYAERFSERFRGVKGHPFENGFDLTLRPERLAQPVKWRQPRRIFVNSMSDLFHKEIPTAFIDSVFDTSKKAPPHIWVGVYIENAQNAVRLKHLKAARSGEICLLRTPPRVRRSHQSSGCQLGNCGWRERP